MKKEIYGLYHDKENMILHISTFHPYTDMNGLDGVVYWNDKYFISNDRKQLRYKAKELRDMWLSEAQARVAQLTDLKPITKY